MKNKKFVPGIILLGAFVAGAGIFSGIIGSQANAMAIKNGTITTKSIDRAYTLSEGTSVNTQLQEEGSALLYNKDNTLPLNDRKVTILGLGSHNYVQGGTGSAGGKDDSNTAMMDKAFENAGIDYNKTAWTWLDNALGNGADVHNGSVNTDYMDSSDASLKGTDFTSYQKVNEFSSATYEKFVTDTVLSGYTDTAIVTFSRSGAEGASPSLDYDGNKDTTTGKTYLELQENEIALLKFCKQKFTHTVVLINSAVPMECGFINNSDFNVDAVLWIGHPGEAGMNGVANILKGNVNPSGHVVDTWSYDMSTNPTYYSADNQEYTNVNSNSGKKYYEYNEGIYVGYRYYETADAAGYFDSDSFKNVKFKGNLSAGNYYSDTSVNGTYAEQKVAGPKATYSGYNEVVQFPFGYGLSYTTFSQEIVKSDIKLEAHKQNSITVRVTNDGNVAGKGVVQVYMEAPYNQDTSLGISGVGLEKAKVVLVGFGKTDTLAPKGSEEITIEFSTDDLASYDEFGKGTYVLEKGDYTFHVSPNAHGWADEEAYGKDYATVKASLSATTVYSADGAGKRVASQNGVTVEEGQQVTNQMNDITAGDGAMLVNGGATGTYAYGYLSRKDFSAGFKEIMSYQSDDYTGVYSGNGYVWSADGKGTTALVNGGLTSDGQYCRRKTSDIVQEQIDLAPKTLEVDGVSQGKDYNYSTQLASGISFGDGKTSKKLYGYGNDAYINMATTLDGKSVDDESYLKADSGIEIKFNASYYVALDADGNTVKADDGYVAVYDTEAEAAAKGTATKLQVTHMNGVPSSDDRWDKLANETSFLEADNLIGDNGWKTPAVESVGKKKTLATDGPGEAGNAQNPDYTWWNCAVIIAATFNTELAEQQGAAYGHQDLLNNTPYCYAPAMNTHRTPFGGRNFEYYSEDGFIAGMIGGHVVQGLQSTGMHVFIKHYALNDSDTNRGGVCTWADEASIREIYAKPYEICCKYFDADGMMGSLNRLGMAWAHTGFYQEMTRDEWNWKGMLVTDGDGSSSDGYNNYSFWTICNEGCILGSGQLSSNKAYRTIGTDGSNANNYIKYVVHNIARYCLYQYGHNIDALNALTTTTPNYTLPIALIVSVDAVLLVAAVIVLFTMVLPKKEKPVVEAN